MDRKKLPIGISDYKLLVSEDYYYVDKTDFIRQVVEEGSLITLLPRPRRFGKTLNLSTLRYFFEKTEGNVYRPLFKGKSIEQWKDFDKYQGQYPVIFITLKDCKGETFEEVLLMLAGEIKSEYIRHDYLQEHIRQEDNLDQFIRLQNRKATPRRTGRFDEVVGRFADRLLGNAPARPARRIRQPDPCSLRQRLLRPDDRVHA